MTDRQRQEVLDNIKAVKASFDKVGGKYAGTVIIDKGDGITVTVERTRYEYTSQKAAKDRAKEIIDAVKAGVDTHSKTVINETPPEDPDDGEGEGDEGGEE